MKIIYKLNRITSINIILFILFALSILSCKLSDRDLLAPPEETTTLLPSSIAKWYNNHKAAMSLTEDHGWLWQAEYHAKVIEVLKRYNMPLDLDLVTFDIMADSTIIAYLQNVLIPNGFGFFGHGHKHINHDALSYDDALASFKKCYECIVQLGIKPVAYAYTGGWGFLLKTRTALKDSGFLCGRRFDELDNVLDPYIMPDTAMQPKDWFALPSLTMQSVDYQGNVTCVNNTAELITYLDKAVATKAWLISTYHYIGNTNEWGYYELSEFENDLQAIKNRDIWCEHLANVTLYVYERKNAQLKAELVKDKYDEPKKINITLSDGLPNDFYNQPLTINFELPKEWVNKKLVLSSGGNKTEELLFVNTNGQISILPNDIENYYTIRLK